MMCILVLITPLILTSQDKASNCTSGSHQIVQPFLGEWDEFTVTDTGEVYIGRLSSKLNLNGCVLNQRFATPDSSFSYHSHGFVNPASNIWEETYVFSSGGHSTFLWIVEGNELYTLRVDGSRHPDYIHRLWYTDVTKNQYLVIQQEATDGGRTWVSKDSTLIKRVN